MNSVTGQNLAEQIDLFNYSLNAAFTNRLPESLSEASWEVARRIDLVAMAPFNYLEFTFLALSLCCEVDTDDLVITNTLC